MGTGNRQISKLKQEQILQLYTAMRLTQQRKKLGRVLSKMPMYQVETGSHSEQRHARSAHNEISVELQLYFEENKCLID